MAESRAWCRVTVVGPGGTDLATYVVRGRGGADLAAVDALARLHLAALRLGCRIALDTVSEELRSLLELAGLLGQMRGQSEDGEQALSVEEEVHPRDATS